MFIKRFEPFGNHQKLIIQNAEKQFQLSLIPSCGATVLELIFDGKNILDSYNSPEELEARTWSKSAFLFPFPNRLKDGKYTLTGKEYQFPINDTTHHNALHGFGMQKSFSIKNIILNQNDATVCCSYEYDGNNAAYPFPFLCEISFYVKLSAEHKPSMHKFEIEMFFENNSQQTIPVGLGWHPYFVLDNQVDDCILKMPPSQIVEVDDKMIPTGKKYDYTKFENLPAKTGGEKIDKEVLENCFEIKNKSKREEIELEGKFGKIKYWQDAEFWKFVQIFTPSNRTSIAIEPMTCNIDAFNNLDGIVMLEKGKNIKGKFGILFSND